MPTLNVALKSAIFESRKKQKRIAKLAGISETQLSHAVRGRRDLTPKERARVAAVLGRTEADLFPDAPMQEIATPAHSTQNSRGGKSVVGKAAKAAKSVEPPVNA